MTGESGFMVLGHMTLILFEFCVWKDATKL